VAACPIITPDASDEITATVSIGLATYPSDGETDEILLTSADEAMYIAKRMGRNQVRTAAEVCQMSADVELMALLQEAKQKDDAQRDGVTLEHLREAYTQNSGDLYDLGALKEIDALDAQTLQATVQRLEQGTRGKTCWHWCKEAGVEEGQDRLPANRAERKTWR
jgi:hypothetical protein